MSKENYKNGVLDGPYERYDENGKLLYKVTYKDGDVEGPFEPYS